MIFKYYRHFLNAGKFILSGIVGALTVVLINHFKQKYDANTRLRNDIYSLLCKFFFISSIQYSELVNKKKEIEDKLLKIKSLTEQSPAEDIVYVVQDLDYDAKITICVNDLSDALFKLKCMKNYQSGDALMLQPFYLANDKYHEIISHFSRFNEMKRTLKDEHLVSSILTDFEKYMPVVLEKIDKELAFIKQTLNSCDELLNQSGHGPGPASRTGGLSAAGSEIRQRQQRGTLRRSHAGRLLAAGRTAGQPARHRRAGYLAGRGGPVQHQGSRGGPAGPGRREGTARAGRGPGGGALSIVAYQGPAGDGGETTYEITVVNQGSGRSFATCKCRLVAGRIKAPGGGRPTRYTIESNKVLFETIPQLAPKSVAAFRVRAQGIRAGDLRVRCQLMTDELQRPVVKLESTRVYADE